MEYTLKFPDQLKAYLRSFRKARGLTQIELAVRLGVAQSRISAIGKNLGVLSVDNHFELLSVLNVELVLRDRHPGPTSKDQDTW
ncbi:helix-turn-helix domain-containing protein [Sulfurirhabdus autotrophica]|uniref:HTH-type transcriptional regulator/antitoxin HipB n=1 Tax=Sulfurirhabdus autotrophica TaxID=1706046 RepID=A0A4R3XW19_9PROT|nr:HTH-type transcriptional regulator/antitoxin HipB [Sulfurirhabdus autotrophica]